VVADAKHGLEFFEGGGGVFFDVGAKLFRVELAPFAPTLFRSERAGLSGRQIPVNRAPPQVKTASRLDLGTAAFEEFDHPLPQVQPISLHAPKLIRLCANVYMNCYMCWFGWG